jgi:hypothetical protein
MVSINGMLITPWHPIRLEGEWVFPNKVHKEQIVKLDYVYNLVLESGHVALINRVECCTIGHGFTENSVI